MFRGLVTFVAGILLFVPGDAGAQGIHAGWMVRQRTLTHVARVDGPTVAAEWKVGRRTALRLSWASLHGESGVYSGDTCGGFVPPDCPRNIAVRDESRMSSGTIGVSIAMMMRDRFALELDIEAHGARMWERTEEITGASARSAEAFVQGVGTGLTAAAYPVSSLPVAITASVGVAAFGRSVEDVDAYQPFQNFQSKEARIGLAFRLPRGGP